MVSEELLAILVCPETKQKLSLADTTQLDGINERIRSATLKNRAGEMIQGELSGALIREDGLVAYPVKDDIPVLLTEESFQISD